MHAHHRVWCINEKGALAAAAAFPGVPGDFAARVSAALAGLDAAAVETADELVREVGSGLA